MAVSVFITPGLYSSTSSAVTFSVPVVAPQGSVGAPGFAFTGATTSGLTYLDGPILVRAGTGAFQINGSTAALLANYPLAFSATDIASADVSLSRGAANRLDLATGDSFRLVSGVVTGGGLLSPLATVTTDATAGIIAYTAAQVAGGLILRDCNGAGRADTVPTAAALLAVIPGAQVGQSLRFTIRNTSGTAVAITVSTASGATLSGTMTIAQNNSKDFLAVFTNVTAASEAYTLYSLGTVVF